MIDLSKINKAAKAASTFYHQHRAVMYVGEALEEMGNLEQSVLESRASIKQVQADYDTANADRKVALDALEKAQVNLTAAEEEAAVVRLHAEAEAGEIKANAAIEVAGLLFAAKADADASAEAMHAAERQNASDMEDAREELARLQGAIAAAEGQIADVEGKLQAIRDGVG